MTDPTPLERLLDEVLAERRGDPVRELAALKAKQEYAALIARNAELEADVERLTARFSSPIVCLCGSTRFMDAFREANLRLTLAGRIVLTVGCDTKNDADLMAAGTLTEDLKARLDDLHRRKIDLCDEVYVLNVGGYIGESTASEIAYAESIGRQVSYLEPHAAHEPAPEVKG